MSGTHALGGFLLLQAKAVHGFSDLDDYQASFDLGHFNVWQTKVGIHVAGTSLQVDAIYQSISQNCPLIELSQ